MRNVCESMAEAEGIYLKADSFFFFDYRTIVSEFLEVIYSHYIFKLLNHCLTFELPKSIFHVSSHTIFHACIE